MNPDSSQSEADATCSPAATSELNNLLEIISGTSAALEKIWGNDQASESYLELLRTSIDRATQVASQLTVQAGGSDTRALFHPERITFVKTKSAAEAAPEKKCLSILVVDDEPMALALNKRVLLEAGFDVVTAQSGFECLDLFRKRPHRFDLVLLDLTMPFMDGEETFNRLRGIRPEVVAVLSTGFITQERLDRMISSGIAGFLRRPHKPDELVAHIKAIFEGVKLSRAGCAIGGIGSPQ